MDTPFPLNGGRRARPSAFSAGCVPHVARNAPRTHGHVLLTVAPEVPADQIVGEQRQQGGRGAIDHFAIPVESRAVLEEVKQRLADYGADIGEIQRLEGDWSLFFRDVDGMELEVCAPADD
jgi:catechol 2,3-dioxygenase-like lactoylglutathione lyase family enzyme